MAGEDAVPVTIERISALLRQRHQIPAGQPNDFTVRDLGEMVKALRSTGDWK